MEVQRVTKLGVWTAHIVVYILFTSRQVQEMIQFPPEMDENWLRNGLVN